MVTALTEIAKDLAPTGVLRASINLGNPVLAQGTPEDPGGVTVDIAANLAERLGLALELVCFDAARTSFEALKQGRVDLGFLAIEPAREGDLTFTGPYIVIEGVFAVARDSRLHRIADVDESGVRIGVKKGSAYDLFLSRTLLHATIVSGEEGTDVFLAQGLEVAAGIREPMTAFVQAHPELRLLEGRFMQIRQAVAATKSRRPETLDFLNTAVEELRASGFVRDSVVRSGQSAAIVAGPDAPPHPEDDKSR